MKTLILSILFVILTPILWSQEDTTAVAEKKLVRLIQTDKTELVGYVLKQDEREIQFETQDGRKIFIPQYVIREIIPLSTSDFNVKGDYVGEDMFATRYFITTNGLPVKKGEHYIQWNLFGPDFQFALSDNFGVGLMTSWMAMPLVGTAKYSFKLKNEKNQFAIGALLGTSSWAAFSGANFGGALPFATLSHGSRTGNIAVSGGYGAVWIDGDVQGRALTSIAGMVKVGPKISLVFDSFIIPRGKTETINSSYTDYVYNQQTQLYDEVIVNYTEERTRPGLALLIPGVRWHIEEGKAFQFGFTGVIAGDFFVPVPIPMVQWYRRI
jgi:hypothetical protein